MAEGRDWTRVVAEQRCPDCGLEASAVDRDALGPGIVAEAERWQELLRSGEDAALRRRPAPAIWSALEYACHVRDLLPIMAGRARRALVEEAPEFGWWHHDRAVTEERYAEQDPAEVAGRLRAGAEDLAAVLAGVEEADWERWGMRGDGHRFSLETIGRFTLHEARHHRHDAEVGLAG